ncbi:hypothetical protein V8E51_015888 [Hyaloscypha variabilis]
MSWSSLSAHAPNRRTGCKGPITPIKSFDLNGSQVQERANMCQECRPRGSFAATWPRVSIRRKWSSVPDGSPLSPRVSNPRQLRTNSQHRRHETSPEIFLHSKPLRTLESVDRNSLPLRPTKRDSLSDGSPVKQSEEMEQSRRWKYETADIPDQQETVPQAAISTPPEKENDRPTSNSEASLDETPPKKTTIKSQSKDDELQLYRLLQRMRRLREMTWGLRSRVQEQRGILRSKQYVKAAADDKYIQLARRKETRADRDGRRLKSSEGKTLQELFQDCEQVRAEYGPLEDDCNALEDQLGSREYELTRLEENFAKLCNILFPHESRSPSFEENVEEQSERSDSDVVQNFHPLVSEYLSKLGDVGIFRERHERHMEEKEALEADRETLQRLNLSLTPENEAWLQQADEVESEILRDLQKAETEAEELRNKCLAAGLLDNNGEPKAFQAREQEAFSEEEDMDPKGQTSEYVKFPTLLPQPGTRNMKFKGSAPRFGEQSGSAGDHVNQWLLHSLRTSPLDVNLLARTFEAEVGDIEAPKWETEVRDYWYKDGAIKGAAGYRIYSVESETTPVYGRSKPSRGAMPEEKIEPVQGVTGKGEVSDASSISGSDFYGTGRENERGVDPLPRSKYDREGI